MQASICKEFRFEAAHSLPNHDGKCRGLHGHSYRVVVEVAGAISIRRGAPDEGMVLDFGALSRVWKELLPRLDHRFLNDSIGPDLGGPSTAENIAVWIFDEVTERLKSGVVDAAEQRLPWVSAVSVWETATGCATVRR